MHLAEVGRLLALIRARYPNANLGDPELAARAWAMTLDTAPYDAAEAALRVWFRREKWAPDAAELRELIAERAGVLPSLDAGWAAAREHIRRHGEVGGAPFGGSPAVEEAVNAVGGWRALRRSEQPERDREAFERAYRAIRLRHLGNLDLGAAIAALNGGPGMAGTLPERVA